MNVLLIDVRTKEEYQEYHKVGAINIPVEELFLGRLGVIGDANKEAPIYLYCRSGSRSQGAKEVLETLGYTNVTNVGGLEDVLE